MKIFSTSFWRKSPRASKADWFLLFGPALLWGMLAGQGRQYFIEPSCSPPDAAKSCSADDVNVLDRVAIPMRDDQVYRWSDYTQNSAGVVAFVVPAIWVAFSSVGAAAIIGTDLLLLAQATVWNGALNETIRAMVQRPRPYVYRDPHHYGATQSHYTSFYSGHTSFAALAGTTLVTALLARGAPALLVLLSTVIGAGLTVVTGYFRVASGQHYPTDVLFGAVAGIAVALLVGWVHRRKARSSA